VEYNFKNEVKLFMIFDILGDTERTGPLLWQIERKRLEDVKNHVLDLMLIVRILKKHFSLELDYDRINDYIMCHDLPEAITGDITKFEGVSDEERKRVTKIAIDYLSSKFDSVLDLYSILNNYENRVDIESKIVHMIDKDHSSSTFMKYQSEKNVDMEDPRVIPDLRNHPFVVQKIGEGKDLADIFFEFHLRAVEISDEECVKYGINRDDADNIVNVIKSFANEMYNQKLNGTLLGVKSDFPVKAMQYNRNK
jgi:5'-deoxynucleotidase YfbR-like HD superfamily hydrolase